MDAHTTYGIILEREGSEEKRSKKGATAPVRLCCFILSSVKKLMVNEERGGALQRKTRKSCSLDLLLDPGWRERKSSHCVLQDLPGERKIRRYPPLETKPTNFF